MVTDRIGHARASLPTLLNALISQKPAPQRQKHKHKNFRQNKKIIYLLPSQILRLVHSYWQPFIHF